MQDACANALAVKAFDAVVIGVAHVLSLREAARAATAAQLTSAAASKPPLTSVISYVAGRPSDPPPTSHPDPSSSESVAVCSPVAAPRVAATSDATLHLALISNIISREGLAPCTGKDEVQHIRLLHKLLNTAMKGRVRFSDDFFGWQVSKLQ